MGQENQKSLEKALEEVLGWRKKVHAWLNSDNKVVANITFRPKFDLLDTHILLQAIRATNRWCCIDISSDYAYMWDMSLIPGYKEPSENEHKPVIKVRADTFQELIVECLFAIQKYDASNSKS